LKLHYVLGVICYQWYIFFCVIYLQGWILLSFASSLMFVVT
jgi:hypothetical protein